MSVAVMGKIPEDLDDLTVLDVACAKGFLGYQIRTKRTGDHFLIGFDLWPPYIEEVLRFQRSYAGIYNDVLVADARNMPFRDEAVDIAVSPELLEHMSCEDGHRVLRELERVSRGMVLVSTPNLFIDQAELDQNPYQRHLSVWCEEDLGKLGYSTQTIFPDGKPQKPAPRVLARLVSKRLGMIVAWKAKGSH